MSKKHIDSVIEELDLDATDPLTKLFAIALGMRNAHDETKAALERCQQEIHSMHDQIASMKAEAEANRLNAERYVWMRDEFMGGGILIDADGMSIEQFEAAIDKERSNES